MTNLHVSKVSSTRNARYSKMNNKKKNEIGKKKAREIIARFEKPNVRLLGIFLFSIKHLN